MTDSRRKSESADKPTTKSGKLPVAEQATFSKFFLVLIMHMCKKILIRDTTRLVWFYLCAITVISLLTDLFPFPKTYFSNKNHIWNQYFVKLGWAWTLVALTPFMCLTNYVLSCGKKELVYRHLARLIVATASWFVVTNIMSMIENRTGACTAQEGEYFDRYTCVSNGGTWNTWFDISGHTFLLVHCILTITEEAAVFRDWSKLNELLRKEDKSVVNHLSSGDFEKLKSYYSKYTPFVQCSAVFLSIIQVLWNVMLLSTTVYFHIMPDKFAGAVLAALSWLFSYRVFYKQSKSIPGPVDLTNAPFKQVKLA